MKTSLLWKRLLITCLSAATLTGCSIGAAETPAVERTEFPTGRFVDEGGNRALEFDKDGNWRYFEGDMESPAVSGKYATNGNLTTFMLIGGIAHASSPLAAPNAPAAATIYVDVQPCGGYARDTGNNVLQAILCTLGDYVLLGQRQFAIHLPLVLQNIP